MSEEVARRVADLVTEALREGLPKSYEMARWTDIVTSSLREDYCATTIEVTDRTGRLKCRVRIFP